VGSLNLEKSLRERYVGDSIATNAGSSRSAKQSRICNNRRLRRIGILRSVEYVNFFFLGFG
jgi:hypothetical protein